MKVKLSNDEEIELNAIPLTKREVTRNVNRALSLAGKLEDFNDDAFGEEFTALEDQYLSVASEAMKAMDIPLEKVCEADVPHILVYFRTGKWKPEAKAEVGGVEGKDPAGQKESAT